MTFYSYVFPNTALTTATFAIAKALDNRPIRILGCVMTILLLIVWLSVFVMMIRAVIHKDILWPQKQEDREEGGWTKNESERVVCGNVRRCATHPLAPGALSNELATSGADVGLRQDASLARTAGARTMETPDSIDAAMDSDATTAVMPENLINGDFGRGRVTARQRGESMV